MPSTTTSGRAAPQETTLVALQDTPRDTIPRLFFSAIERLRSNDALRFKEDGEWKRLSHAEVEERVRQLAAALASAGVERGDRVAILSENRPEWAIADYAITCSGAIDVPLYPTLPPDQIAYILQDAGAKAILVSTQEQLAKVLEIRDDLADLKQVICCDDPGGAAGVERLHDVLESGRRLLESGDVADLRESAETVERDDVATLIYTSGTTGKPKGVMLTHWNLASNVAAVQQHGAFNVGQGDVSLSFLPLSHVFERMVDYVYWDTGVAIAYAEAIDKIADNLVEVSPTVVVSVPRVFDKIYTKVSGATGVKGKLVAWAKGVGMQMVDERAAGREPDGMLAFQYKLADKLVFSKLRARTGGGIRSFFSCGAPLSAEVAKFFLAAGLPIYEGYGLTETSPVITVNTPEQLRIGTVGLTIPGSQVRIADGGEILTRGPNVMKGYWNAPDATAEVLDDDGWFHTGDVGELDAEGFLRITDRIKNILVTAGGKNIAPQPLENAAAMSQYVAQVVMLGDRRAFPTLLVVPDYENLTVWAEGKGIDTSDPQHLASDPRVHELLESETLSRVEHFARYERPKKISIIAEEFTVADGTLTPTMKVKRRVVEERYAPVIEAMYS
ncbi:AMP-dependent synthetase/ligase [soil metagenome]